MRLAAARVVSALVACGPPARISSTAQNVDTSLCSIDRLKAEYSSFKRYADHGNVKTDDDPPIGFRTAMGFGQGTL